MTLILTAMNTRCVIQISDRRLTANGVLVDDEANKAIALTTPDARLTVGYTGLARAGSFSTRDWIMETIQTATIVDASAAGIITRFANIATKTFKETGAIRRVAAAARRLDVVFAGYHYAAAPPLMVYARVSNLQVDGSIGDFSIKWNEERRHTVGTPVWLSAAGNSAALQANDISTIEKVLRKLTSPHDLQSVLHSIMIKVADRKASEDTIGKQFDTIILEREGEISTVYDSAIVKNEVHMPASIFVLGPNNSAMVKDLSIQAMDRDEAMIVPRVHRNRPCPCGSEKRYRECHGRSLPQ